LTWFKPCGLGDVFELRLGMREVKTATLQMGEKPELDVPTLWVEQILDVQEAVNLYAKPCLLPNLPRGRFFIAFVALNAAARSDPEVVPPGPKMVNHEETTLMFNDCAGGDAIGVQV
jgi:hypothetical protein